MNPPPATLPPLIGFCGPAGAGKTTAALIASGAWEQCHRISFADPIRRMLSCLGLSADDLQRDKELPHMLLGGKTPRHAMQTLGTDWARNMIDPEIWLRVARHQALQIMELGGVPVFDDVRFDNEAEMIRLLGGEVIKVVRPSFSPATPASHVSEAGVRPGLVSTTLLADNHTQLQTLLFSHFNRQQ